MAGFSWRPVVAAACAAALGSVFATGAMLAGSQVRAAEPQPDFVRWYKGNLHTHTSRSDGDSDPAVVVRWYRDHGDDFVVLTDHDQITEREAAKLEPGAPFALIPGEEITGSSAGLEDGQPRLPVHVNALSLTRVVAPFKGSSPAETLVENLRRAREAGGLPLVNHPNFGWALALQDLRAVPGDFLLEIWSGHPLVHHQGGGDRLSAKALWDALLTEGRRVFGVAVDDSHHFTGEFASDRANPGRGFVAVRSSELTAAALVEALARGDFYASNGVELVDVKGSKDGLEVSVAARPSFRYAIEFIGERGTVLAREAGPQAHYSFRGKELYVRARVRDSMGHEAWTQPCFLPRP